VAEHRPLLRLDLILVVRAAGAALPKPDGGEDRGDADGEQGLDDRSADPAVGD
jgi:hypothetical protein